jgi:hypothetical protein
MKRGQKYCTMCTVLLCCNRECLAYQLQILPSTDMSILKMIIVEWNAEKCPPHHAYGTVPRDFRLRIFFHESVSPKPLSIQKGAFQFFFEILHSNISNIRERNYVRWMEEKLTELKGTVRDYVRMRDGQAADANGRSEWLPA